MPATESPATGRDYDDTGLCVRSALHPEGSKQRFFSLTRITLLVPQSEKPALRQIKLDAMKRSRSQRLRHDQIRNCGGGLPGFHRRAHGFIRRQLKPDIKFRQLDAEFPEGGLEHGPGAGAWLSQNPACLRQMLWYDARLADPRVARSDHDGQRIAFHFSNGQRGIVNLAFSETEVCISPIDSLGNPLGVCDRD